MAKTVPVSHLLIIYILYKQAEFWRMPVGKLRLNGGLVMTREITIHHNEINDMILLSDGGRAAKDNRKTLRCRG